MSDAQPRRGPRHVNVGPAAVVAETTDAQEPTLYRVPDELGVRVTDPAGGLHWPGEEFEAVYPLEQETRLIRRGQITRVAPRPHDPKGMD